MVGAFFVAVNNASDSLTYWIVMTATLIKKTQKTHWQTWWSIIGPRMPLKDIQLSPNIFLGPIGEKDYADVKAMQSLRPQLSMSSGSYVVRSPPQDEVYSYYKLQIDVHSVGEDEAVNAARRIADRLIASLSLAVPGHDYYANFVKFREAGSDEQKSAWSPAGQIFSVGQPAQLSPDDIHRALQIYEGADRDEIAENAYVHLLTAWQLQATAGSKPLARSILQHYVLAMEAIVLGVMKRLKGGMRDDITKQEQEFAAGFAKRLPSSSDMPAAIRSASTSLRDISFTNTLPSIEMVGKSLNITPEIIKSAKDLYRFRSSSLSHPGRYEEQTMQRWLSAGPKIDSLCQADVIARAFLVGYIDNPA